MKINQVVYRTAPATPGLLETFWIQRWKLRQDWFPEIQKTEEIKYDKEIIKVSILSSKLSQ